MINYRGILFLKRNCIIIVLDHHNNYVALKFFIAIKCQWSQTLNINSWDIIKFALFKQYMKMKKSLQGNYFRNSKSGLMCCNNKKKKHHLNLSSNKSICTMYPEPTVHQKLGRMENLLNSSSLGPELETRGLYF